MKRFANLGVATAARFAGPHDNTRLDEFRRPIQFLINSSRSLSTRRTRRKMAVTISCVAGFAGGAYFPREPPRPQR